MLAVKNVARLIRAEYIIEVIGRFFVDFHRRVLSQAFCELLVQ